MTDHWLDDPSPYLDRDDPRCRRHPHELGTNCRLCRSEAIADHDAEPENTEPRPVTARRAVADHHARLASGETT